MSSSAKQSPESALAPIASAAIFAQGSRTYSTASLFFPKAVRADVTTLYAFVRVADNYVDQVPQDKQGFEEFVNAYQHARQGGSFTDQSFPHAAVVNDFCALAKRANIQDEWVNAFFDAMRADLTKKKYHTLDETLVYMYGSAEVIGLMLARIFDLPPQAYKSAQLLGRAMQYANFIRDIAEDVSLGRTYITQDILHKYHLPDLQESTVREHSADFTRMMQAEVHRYQQWQQQAETGYHFLPKQIRVAVVTAADMYVWATSRIAHDPFIVYEKKVKPSKSRILLTGMKNLAFA